MTAPVKRPRLPTGRPSLYRPEYAEQAYKLCLLSATDAEMANFFGIALANFHKWKHAHPEFRDSIARGKEIADASVAERLYQRALGYSHEAVKIFMPAGSDAPVYAPYTEHYPPDTNAASLWLRNRQSGKWRDKTEHEHTHKHEIADLTDAELLAIAGRAGTTEQADSADKPPKLH
jgi:hypothetical protein